MAHAMARGVRPSGSDAGLAVKPPMKGEWTETEARANSKVAEKPMARWGQTTKGGGMEKREAATFSLAFGRGQRRVENHTDPQIRREAI